MNIKHFKYLAGSGFDRYADSMSEVKEKTDQLAVFLSASGDEIDSEEEKQLIEIIQSLKTTIQNHDAINEAMLEQIDLALGMKSPEESN